VETLYERTLNDLIKRIDKAGNIDRKWSIG